jgi:hypothetical protein
VPSHRATRWISSGIALAVAIGGASPVAHAGPPRPTSVVAMGDSYISGEAGRWLGNSAGLVGDHDRTDRACVYALRACTSYDEGRVYVDGTAADGCHRSDVAEILSARIPVDRRINLACSGAVTANLPRASRGGTSAHGEPPQADRLLAVARSTRVRMIVVSVGGNDLDFGPIVRACFTAYLTLGSLCSRTRAAALSDARLAQVTASIERALNEIRAVMRLAGYRRRDYRLVAQTYPVVLPHAVDARYPQGDPRRTIDGCPFYDADMNWTKDVAAPRIGRAVSVAAAASGAEVLELVHAFDGHELCAKTDAAVSPLVRPSATRSEWGRAISASTIVQGESQELFHPNAFGQMALGRCIGALYAARRGAYACAGAAGHGPADMVLRPRRFPRRPRSSP